MSRFRDSLGVVIAFWAAGLCLGVLEGLGLWASVRSGALTIVFAMSLGGTVGLAIGLLLGLMRGLSKTP